MKPAAPTFDSFIGRTGQIALVMEPKPCNGPLAYSVVTHPAALHIRTLGIDLRPAGAYTAGNRLHCTFKTRDLGRALPVLIAYFETIELGVFCKFAFRLPDPSPAQLASWQDVDPERSYLAATGWTWRDRLRRWRKDAWSTGRILRFRACWLQRKQLGDLSRAFVFVALTAGALAGIGFFTRRAPMMLAGVTLSGLAFAVAMITRPVLTRAAAERLIERSAGELLKTRDEQEGDLP